MEALQLRTMSPCFLLAGLLIPPCVCRDVVDSTLLEFNQITPGQFAKNLDGKRPAAIDAELRSRVIESLPRSGTVKELNTGQRKKLASIDSVLRAHRRDSVYVLRVISLPQAVVALHARSVVLISEAALNLLSEEELQAVVAHEIGHEYFWDDYLQASDARNLRVLQKVELWCDAIAIVTLRQVNIDPSTLITAVQKIELHNRVRFGTPPENDPHPPSADRIRFQRALIHWSIGETSP